MKKKSILRIISVIMSVVIIFSLIAFDSFAAETEDTPSASWIDKIDPILLDKMEGTTDKIPVWLWFQDIDYSVFTTEVYKRTGLTEDNLSAVSESIDDDLAEKIANLDSADYDTRQETNAEFSSYLKRTEYARKLENERTETYISELRQVQKEMYPVHNEQIIEELNIPEEDIISAETQSPFYIVKLDKYNIERLANNDLVTTIDYYDDSRCYDVEDTNSSGDISNVVSNSEVSRIRSELHFTGSGINIAILEPGSVAAHSELQQFSDKITVHYPTSTTVSPTAHATFVARISVGSNGIAPNSKIYSCPYSYESQFKTQAEYLYDKNVYVINNSAGIGRGSSTYTPFERFVDYIAYNKKLLVVNASGNENTDVIIPGMAYNAITVGGFFNSGSHYYNAIERMYGGSNYYHSSNGCIKPDIIAPQSARLDSDGIWHPGTSYAAPFVTGTIALLYELKPSLKAQPESVKAILMASCHRKVKKSLDSDHDTDTDEDIGDGLTERQGAGAVDPYMAISIAASGNYGLRPMEANATSSSVRLVQPGYNSIGFNFSIAWLRETTSTDSDGSYVNLNLQLKNETTNAVKTSNNSKSAAEMCYFKNPTNAPTEYTATVTKPSNTNAVKYAYAFSVSKFRFQNVDYSSLSGNTSDGIYVLKNYASNRFLTNSSGSVIQKGAQTVSQTQLTQLWLLNNNRLTSVSTDKSKIYVGDSMANNYNKVQLNDTGATIRMTPSMVSNGGYTNYLGTYKIITSSVLSLGIYNQSTSNNATAAWKNSSTSDTTQKWYLERAAFQRGDVDMNGVIDSTDADITLSYSAGSTTLTSTQFFLADVNNDNNIDSNDVLTIMQIYT